MDLSNTTTYPDPDIEALVAEMDETVCQYRGFAPTTRTATEVVRVQAATQALVLAWPLVQSITSVTVDGDALDTDTYTLDGSVIYYDSTFSSSYPATVVYTHGATTVSDTLKRATALYVASVFKSEESGVSRDAISQNFDGVTTRYSTPDITAGRPTGWLEVDRLLNLLPDHRLPGIA
jgi:hypothetical protein